MTIPERITPIFPGEYLVAFTADNVSCFKGILYEGVEFNDFKGFQLAEARRFIPEHWYAWTVADNRLQLAEYGADGNLLEIIIDAEYPHH